MSTPNFIKYLTGISDTVLKSSSKIDTLRKELQNLNLKLPATVYIPFVAGKFLIQKKIEKIRNNIVLYIPPQEAKVFVTKTKAPYLISMELYDPLEIVNEPLELEPYMNSVPKRHVSEKMRVKRTFQKDPKRIPLMTKERISEDITQDEEITICGYKNENKHLLNDKKYDVQILKETNEMQEICESPKNEEIKIIKEDEKIQGLESDSYAEELRDVIVYPMNRSSCRDVREIQTGSRSLDLSNNFESLLSPKLVEHMDIVIKFFYKG